MYWVIVFIEYAFLTNVNALYITLILVTGLAMVAVLTATVSKCQISRILSVFPERWGWVPPFSSGSAPVGEQLGSSSLRWP